MAPEQTMFVNGMLVVRLPVSLPGRHGKPWVLEEGDLLLTVLTPGVGLSVLLRVPVLEAVGPGQVGTAQQPAEVELLEKGLGRELTLDDLPPRAL
jgi:hypothetical protein